MEKDTSRAQVWNDILRGFAKKRLKYVLVGGGALIVHGLPRSTLDMDIYIPAQKKVLVELFELMDALGLKSEQRSVLRMRDTPQYYVDQWICFSSHGRDILDVFLAREDIFKKLYKNSIVKRDKVIAVRVASLNAIVAMKKISGRPVDLADIQLIQEAKKQKK